MTKTGVLWFVLVVATILLAYRVRADEVPKIPISVPLLEEVFRNLQAQPYSSVASTISKLQAEVQAQQKPPSEAAAPIPPPPPVVSKEHKAVPN